MIKGHLAFAWGSLFALACGTSSAHAAYFSDHPYIHFADQVRAGETGLDDRNFAPFLKRYAVGRFETPQAYSDSARVGETVTHIGAGLFLVANHVYESRGKPAEGHFVQEVLAEGQAALPPELRPVWFSQKFVWSQYHTHKILVRWLFCVPAHDFCLFRAADPGALPAHLEQVALSTREPVRGMEVFTVGYPGDRQLDFLPHPAASIGEISGRGYRTDYSDLHLLTVSGAGGISNSPAISQADPDLMVLYFNIVGKQPRTQPMDSREAIRAYEQWEKGVSALASFTGDEAEKKAETDRLRGELMRFLPHFNMGVSAAKIAEDIRNSPYADLFCEASDRLAGCAK
ncbi:MAG: hypothetical protein AB7P04_05230 [Bacteriovoracia bacterium]